MKVRISIVLFFSIACSELSAQLFPNLGGQRAGISSFTFLKNDVSPRAIALGGAITTMKGDAYSSHWNPATMTESGSHNFAVSTRMYALGINHSYASANFRLTENDYIGISVNNLSSGQMPIRTEFMPGGTGETFSANSMALGLSYAKALTYKFSAGLSARYIEEKIDMFVSRAFVIDLGFIYKTDFKDLRFGVFLQNFGGNTFARGNYENFSFINKSFTATGYPTPTVFKFGASIVPLKTELHSISVAAEFNHPNDNASNLRFGTEYSFQEILFLRAGYWLNLPGQTIPTAGLGFRFVIKDQIINLNYAFASSNAFGINHNIGIAILINKFKREKSDVEQ